MKTEITDNFPIPFKFLFGQSYQVGQLLTAVKKC